jgi:hypothetical protein
MAMKSSIAGRWRITHMDEWDQEFVDAEVEGFVRFDPDGGGEFQFGYVHGRMTCEQTERGGKPAVEWSWDGNDEMEPASGRGWVTLQDDDTLKGKLFFNRGDSSGFTAKKKPDDAKPDRKAKAIDAKTGRTVSVNVDAIKPGRVRNPTLPEPLLRRIRAVHQRIKGVYDLTLEQFEIAFMRDADAEGEVALWERIVAALDRASVDLPDLDRRMALRTLLAYSMGALTPQEKADPDVRRLMQVVGEE